MPMPPYPLVCYTKDCGKQAVYKIAARWSDGVSGELRTYALSCPDCVGHWLQSSRAKQTACRRAPRETLEPPGIFDLERGQRDRTLHRRADLEEQFSGGS